MGNPELARFRKERYLRRQAGQLGFALTPVGGHKSSPMKLTAFLRIEAAATTITTITAGSTNGRASSPATKSATLPRFHGVQNMHGGE
jgi:hypothetical protein